MTYNLDNSNFMFALVHLQTNLANCAGTLSSQCNQLPRKSPIHLALIYSTNYEGMWMVRLKTTQIKYITNHKFCIYIDLRNKKKIISNRDEKREKSHTYTNIVKKRENKAINIRLISTGHGYWTQCFMITNIHFRECRKTKRFRTIKSLT